MKHYKQISLSLALIFAVVGLLFLYFPGNVLRYFNIASQPLGMAKSPEEGVGFYLILAIGYMYLVTLLAFKMYKHPEERIFPHLLANAKLASSFLSLYLFIFHAHYLIYITNCVVDGAIGLFVLYLYMGIKKRSAI